MNCPLYCSTGNILPNVVTIFQPNDVPQIVDDDYCTIAYLSPYSSIDSWISLTDICIYIIYQTILQAKIMNKFHADNSLLPSQIVGILPCKQSLLMSPLPTQTFLLCPKRIDDPNTVRKPVLWPQHPKVSYQNASDPSTYDVAPVAQQAEVAATNAFAIVQRWYYRDHLLYRKNHDINSLAQSIQRCPEWNKIFAF